ncbi:hypothetical protein M5K25_022232 [Dendrobium thyrsiflorum]|uniref:Uncharacterized protein n=1 Tax=Dendrobium thyrsiflorum TaxID=117978 RepID=A0ABD0U5R3_DENTH
MAQLSRSTDDATILKTFISFIISNLFFPLNSHKTHRRLAWTLREFLVNEFNRMASKLATEKPLGYINGFLPLLLILYVLDGVSAEEADLGSIFPTISMLHFTSDIESPLSAGPKGSGGCEILSPSILLATLADIESPLSAGSKGSGGCGILSPSILLAALADIESPLSAGSKGSGGCGILSPSILLAALADIESPLSASPKGSGGCEILSPSILLAALRARPSSGEAFLTTLFSSGCPALTRWASEFRGLFICHGQADIKSPLSAGSKGSGGCGILSPSILLVALSPIELRRGIPHHPFSSGCPALTRWASEFRGLFICRGKADIESPLSASPKGSGGCGILSPSILLAALADIESPISAGPKGLGGCGILSPSILLAALADIESSLSVDPKGSGGCGILSPSILLTALLREPDRAPARHSSPPFSSDCPALTKWASEFRDLVICCGQLILF